MDGMTVGSPTPRIDGIAKVTGWAKFTGDLDFPGLPETKINRSSRIATVYLFIAARQLLRRDALPIAAPAVRLRIIWFIDLQPASNR